MIDIRIIDEAHSKDILLPNEPFELWGRMIPFYREEKWGYTIEKKKPEEITVMCFPDEPYDFQAMSGNTTFLGAYDADTCIGLALMQEGFFKYYYLYDLKVNREYRRQGVSSLLMQSAMELALQKGYRGIYTIGQDNNLSACLFYISNGFRIGGLDTEVYKGTNQEDKADILFYKDGAAVKEEKPFRKGR